MAARVRERTGQKGKALFHPIRLALTGEPEGLELDLAVPAIERGARWSAAVHGITARSLERARTRGGVRRGRCVDARRAMIVYGINPVLEALRAGRVTAFASASAAAAGCASCSRWPRERGVRVQRVDARCCSIALAHAAACTRASSRTSTTCRRLQRRGAGARRQRSAPLIVVLDGIEDPHNLGAILRTADAAGVDGVVVQNRRSAALGGAAAKASAGAVAHVRVAEVVNIARAIEELKDAGVWTVGLAGDADTRYDAIDFDGADRDRAGRGGRAAAPGAREVRFPGARSRCRATWRA